MGWDEEDIVRTQFQGEAMPLPARRLMPQGRIPDLLDWFDAPWPAMLPFGSNPTFRVEDYVDDGKYMIRAELPGVDPEDDVQVTVDSGALTIRAERHEETKQDRHSEFRYGSLSRTVALPEGADTDKITARYDKGILEVTVPVPERAKAGPRQISVKTSG
jgi:HSP20 family protein